ncbi:phosphatase PAP2 family protein [Sporanaerobacter acetigenes]|uniref:Undecaprenyl-diphosphatase n=1 Tax=Sporanaerobacter acetigenes DSM 13106 TaxID=1123281 RepID=A0A1M5X6Y7_9FIRM|nr:phosphatase PAP2 family protein [Sporanaerobacter acetigenes]SHH95264.1 undecaprenyl-diphosphatase [Sporanaerobacter acetigenes DSM 13106]
MGAKKRVKTFDKKLLHWFNDTIKNKFLDKFMYYITNLGGGWFTTGFMMSLFIFGKNKMRLIGLEGLASLTLSQIFVQILKRSLERERPFNRFDSVNRFNIVLKDYSFPSGHTTASFSIATVMALNFPYIAIPVLLIALLVGTSRMYLGVHYPTDVLAGIAVGVFSSLIVHFQLIDYLKRLMIFMKLA